MMRQYELLELVKSYDPKVNEDLINRAYVYSMKAHGTQKRASGDSYFSHPLEVAGLLTQLKLDSASIATALLHDTVEDTDTTLKDIEKQFGNEVARLVDGVTKLTRLEMQSTSDSSQAENFRKLVLAMSEDIRVLLVKLADRLHNMRTLHFIKKPDKRKRIAIETMEIYVPLAERIGVSEFKSELEDFAFKELYPDARESILKRLSFLRKKSASFVENTIQSLNDIMNKEGIKAEVYGREKAPYSIWRKMQIQNISFEQLSDIIAFRIIVHEVAHCYQALGCIHSSFPMIAERFKDYVSVPKPNGYQSIHTGVYGPENQRIEIQIRTKEMHEIAELGVAAHWCYKQGSRTDGRQYRWLRELLDVLDEAGGAEEFLEHTRLEMFKDQVFCFSPAGDVYSLPVGSTPVDFAYAVHSEVGDHCVGAKINSRMLPLRTQLRNGDQVEIITSKAQTPSPEWERFVATGKARARIRRFIRQQKRQEYITLGKEILQKTFREANQEFTEKAFDDVLTKFKCQEVDDLYSLVGAGLNTGRDVLYAVFPGLKDQELKKKAENLIQNRYKADKNKGNALHIRGLIPGMALHFAKCCWPLPGDRIVGIVTTGKGVTVHTIDCEMLENFADVPERWVDLAWDSKNLVDVSHIGRLFVIIANEPGGLGTLTTVIAKGHGNISNLKITKRSTDFFEMLVDVEVIDLKHLLNIIAALRANPIINYVERSKS